MKTTLMKLLRHARMHAAGIYVITQLRAEKKKSVLTLQNTHSTTLSHFDNFPFYTCLQTAGCRNMHKWLGVHATPVEELLNNR